MRFTTLSVLSATSTFFLARAAPVGEHYSAVPPIPRETNSSGADSFHEIQLPPRQAENIELIAKPPPEAPPVRQPGTDGQCVVV
ncbi:hypothetical protein C8R46DRAFT_185801 [Mycena filopes]|nr:hypothetical protein C8R46DRAFT_185801 [Mycena filopes]